MTEPLPCPFCGHVGLSHYEGLTFRWLTTECNGCGAQCGEERINTMTMERSAAIEQAKVEALKTWNTRFTPFPPQQQAEPSQWRDMVVVSLVREGIDKHKARELADHFAAQQQAEPVSMRMPKVGDKVICLEDESFGEVVSLTGGGSPDITFDDGTRGTYLLREFAELFGYVASPQQDEPPQRQWVGLTDEEIADCAEKMEASDPTDSFWREFFRGIEAKLKEKNT